MLGVTPHDRLAVSISKQPALSFDFCGSLESKGRPLMTSRCAWRPRESAYVLLPCAYRFSWWVFVPVLAAFLQRTSLWVFPARRRGCHALCRRRRCPVSARVKAACAALDWWPMVRHAPRAAADEARREPSTLTLVDLKDGTLTKPVSRHRAHSLLVSTEAYSVCVPTRAHVD
ncbi:hypothetical protein TRVL_04707 [Trypanosoma vivax]|nr:hypothetical protein TRVL_04707 [Trypanosoma vivax]